MNEVVFASRFARSLAKLAPTIALAIFGSCAIAADYPSRPVSLIVPFVAGSATDVFARILAEGLSKELNAPFVVEAKPGGSMQELTVMFIDVDAFT